MGSLSEFSSQLAATVPAYLNGLAVQDMPGQFRPCLKGATELGSRLTLGYSCFALKTVYTIRHWDQLSAESRARWLDLIRSFQLRGRYVRDVIRQDAFLDPTAVAYLESRIPMLRRVVQRISPGRVLTYVQKVIVSETKQAIATLADVGERPDRYYMGFPHTPEGAERYLRALDWAMPWAGGAQAAVLATFLASEAPHALSIGQSDELVKTSARFIRDLADPVTGAYFRGLPPGHDQLINGAMKVLTALDWLDEPVHYPERLIDTCLCRLPRSDGCHLVDAVYVLYRCLQESSYRRADVRDYCCRILEMIKQHHNADGGFSYSIGRSQTEYYGVPISHGLRESDIHGTCLLTWAVAMILEIADANARGWRVIKP